MIDPKNIIKYNRNSAELEELAVFCVLVAGKTAHVVKTQLEGFRKQGAGLLSGRPSLFKIINAYTNFGFPLSEVLKSHGIGCQTQKARTLRELAASGLDLKTCSIADLEQIPGIGRKTSRFFMMSSRHNVQCAALDTHVLKWLRANGITDAPKATPSSHKQYIRLEKEFLRRVPKGKTPAQFDIEIWNSYAVQ